MPIPIRSRSRSHDSSRTMHRSSCWGLVVSQPELTGLYPRSSDPSELRNSQIEQARNIEALLLRLHRLERQSRRASASRARSITVDTAIASGVAGAVWGLLSYWLG